VSYAIVYVTTSGHQRVSGFPTWDDAQATANTIVGRGDVIPNHPTIDAIAPTTSYVSGVFDNHRNRFGAIVTDR
jgi:hypothetical protein